MRIFFYAEGSILLNLGYVDIVKNIYDEKWWKLAIYAD